MNSEQRCPNCNGPLAVTTGQPMCPVCLMRSALEPTDSELAEPELAATQSVTSSGNWDSMRSVSPGESGAELEPGQDFGDYRIIGRLGRGGMGVVYEADHRPTGRRVALKVLAQSLDHPEAKSRFIREGRLAASINHRNSVYVYGTEEINGIPTITMELVRGGTLSQIVKDCGPMRISDAVDAVLQIVDGLAAADQRGVLHRDVKPSNCFVSPDGTVKVGDFGLSISTTGNPVHSITEVTTEGTFLGTPAFASPEQLRGEPLDRRSDIYSIGVTLFYLVTGKVPFDADNMVHLLATVLDKPAPSAKQYRSEIPTELDQVITRCLQKPAGNRFADYESLRSVLLPLSSAAPMAATLGTRTLAQFIDMSVIWVVVFSINLIARPNSEMFSNQIGMLGNREILLGIFVNTFLVAYYALCEWRFGCTIGKRVFALRVRSGDQRPRLSQTAVRAILFVLVPTLPSLAFNFANHSRDISEIYSGSSAIVGMLVGWSYFLLTFGLFITARSSNGFAAIHDLITRTRVVQTSPQPHTTKPQVTVDEFSPAKGVSMVGPYHRLQSVFERESDQLILGYDSKLLRRVWIHVQSPDATPVDPRSNDQSSHALRWLGGRRDESSAWDCYESPSGVPFRKLPDNTPSNRVIRVLRKLVHLLSTRDPSLIHSDQTITGIDRIWVTDDDEVKILPFEFPTDSQLSKPTATTSIGLLHDVADVLNTRSTSVVSHQHAWPLSVSRVIERISSVNDLTNAQAILSDTDLGRLIRVKSRVLGMVAVSLTVPLLTVFFGLFMMMIFRMQQQQNPEIAELHEVVQVLNREGRLLSAQRQDGWETTEKYIAGHFRELINDKRRMNSLFAVMKVPMGYRDQLHKALEKHSPTEKEMEVIDQEFALLRDAWKADPSDTPTLTFQFWTPLGPALTWLEFIWFPSLLTGLLFRGGILMRIFGLTLVNSNGQQVSRLRVSMRMLLSGLPAIAVIYAAAVFVFSPSVDFPSPDVHDAVIGCMLLGIGITMAWVPYQWGNQCLCDRLAGTYFVAK